MSFPHLAHRWEGHEVEDVEMIVEEGFGAQGHEGRAALGDIGGEFDIFINGKRPVPRAYLESSITSGAGFPLIVLLVILELF